MSDRLFVAVELPEQVREELEVFVGPRRDAEPGLRWTTPENWHLTLAFLDTVPPVRQEGLVDHLTTAAARSHGFRLTVGGAGAFPHPDAARVLWLGAKEGIADLRALARRVRTACDRAGVPPDGTRFTGHLTLARARIPVEALRWLRILDAFPDLSWDVAGFDLVESTLARGGSVYRVRETFPFGGSASSVRHSASPDASTTPG